MLTDECNVDKVSKLRRQGKYREARKLIIKFRRYCQEQHNKALVINNGDRS